MTRHQRRLRALALRDDLAAIRRLIADTPSSHPPCFRREGILGAQAWERSHAMDHLSGLDAYQAALVEMETEVGDQIAALLGTSEVSR